MLPLLGQRVKQTHLWLGQTAWAKMSAAKQAEAKRKPVGDGHAEDGHAEVDRGSDGQLLRRPGGPGCRRPFQCLWLVATSTGERGRTHIMPMLCWNSKMLFCMPRITASASLNCCSQLKPWLRERTVARESSCIASYLLRLGTLVAMARTKVTAQKSAGGQNL